MSELSSLDTDPPTDLPQYARQTNAMTIALLRREKIILEFRVQEIDKEIETLTANG